MADMVLVVDDDAAIRELLETVLEEEGYGVRLAEDGQAALAIAEAEPPDVVVSDVRMPRLDGLELVRRLRERGSAVPVVLVSAHHTGVVEAGVRLLRKPFALGDVLAAVEAGLAGRVA